MVLVGGGCIIVSLILEYIRLAITVENTSKYIFPFRLTQYVNGVALEPQ